MDATITPIDSPPDDDDIIENTANAQLKAMREHLRQKRISDEATAQVKDTLRREGIDLDAIAIHTIADQRLQQMLQRDQVRSANALARELYKKETGLEWEESPNE